MTEKTYAIVLLVGILAFCFGSLLVGCTPTPGPAMRPPIHQPPLPAPPPGVAQELLDSHNNWRAGFNLPPLALNPKLQAAAQAHADFMARVGRMAHQGIGDGDPFTRIQGAGYTFQAAGENVAWGQQTIPSVMTTWMNSPGHRANILGKYTEAGLAVAYGAKKDPYWSVSFGTPMGSGRGTSPRTTTITGPGVTSDVRSAASSTGTTPTTGR